MNYKKIIKHGLYVAISIYLILCFMAGNFIDFSDQYDRIGFVMFNLIYWWMIGIISFFNNNEYE